VQQLARAAPERGAHARECREADAAYFARAEQRQLRFAQAHALRELLARHPTPGEHGVQRDLHRHQKKLSSSSRIDAACFSSSDTSISAAPTTPSVIAAPSKTSGRRRLKISAAAGLPNTLNKAPK